MDYIEKGTTRRHVFFSITRAPHTEQANFIEATPKQIRVFDRVIDGWLITTEESAIDKVISLDESFERELVLHDPE